MPNKKINLYSILENDEKLFQDVIDGELSYTIAKSIIYGWMKEACKQTLELAAENVQVDMMKKSQYGKYRKWQKTKKGEEVDMFSYDLKWIVDKQSIINTINQIK